MYSDEQTKQNAEKAYYAQTPAPSTPEAQMLGYANATTEGRPSLRAEAEKQVGYHRTQAGKHDRAAAFFRENPAFDEFIQLVRSGAIQF